jgi:cell division protein FtsW (lipid II flippase)
VSYGGSSLLSSFVAIGFVLNVGLRPGFVLARHDFGD